MLEAHICVAPRRVNRVFATLLQSADEPAPTAVPGAGAYKPDGVQPLGFESQGAGKSRDSGPRLRALDVGPHCVGLGLDPLHPVFHEVANRHDAANLPALNNWKMTDSLLGDERKRV